MKKDAWVKIQDEYNCQSIENPRTATVLKNKYDNIKRMVKKQYADEKSFNRGTGGGPTKIFPDSSIALTVGETLQTRMTGEPSVYDSDVNVLLENNSNREYLSEEEIVTVNFEDTFTGITIFIEILIKINQI